VPRPLLVAGLVLAFVALLAGGAHLLLDGGKRRALPRASLGVSDVLGEGADSAGYSRAETPRVFRFPRDHGPHPGFRTEWWYLTGNLTDSGGDPFGFQLTFFRSALRPEPPGGASAWRTNQVYMGHFAVTDGAGEVFHAFERFSRGAVGLAGAGASPFRVWIDDWELRTERWEQSPFPMLLTAAGDGVALDLRLSPLKPLVLQGEEGLSRKGPGKGNASYYYSFTRLRAEGEVVLPRGAITVEGTAWMDREWSTSALAPGQVGWDWFALQLDDGHDLMYYQLRREDGSASPFSAGRWVAPDGAHRALASHDVRLRVTERWRSPLDAAVYPSGWRLEVPAEELVLQVVPLLPDQELDLTFRYWEGAVRVEGTREGKAVEGRGYVELTGYAGEADTGPTERRLGRTGRD
jgi:predicted secreted hydrolase